MYADYEDPYGTDHLSAEQIAERLGPRTCAVDGVTYVAQPYKRKNSRQVRCRGCAGSEDVGELCAKLAPCRLEAGLYFREIIWVRETNLKQSELTEELDKEKAELPKAFEVAKFYVTRSKQKAILYRVTPYALEGLVEINADIWHAKQWAPNGHSHPHPYGIAGLDIVGEWVEPS